MVFPVHVLNFIKLYQVTSIHCNILEKTQKTWIILMHAVGRGVGIHYHPSLPRILHLTSVLFICRMGPRGLPWQGFDTAGICKNFCCSGMLVVSFKYLLYKSLLSYIRMWLFLHISLILKHGEVFKAHQLSETSRRKSDGRNYIYLVPTGCHGDLKKKTTTLASHPCVARSFFTLRGFLQ